MSFHGVHRAYYRGAARACKTTIFAACPRATPTVPSDASDGHRVRSLTGDAVHRGLVGVCHLCWRARISYARRAGKDAVGAARPCATAAVSSIALDGHCVRSIARNTPVRTHIGVHHLGWCACVRAARCSSECTIFAACPHATPTVPSVTDYRNIVVSTARDAASQSLVRIVQRTRNTQISNFGRTIARITGRANLAFIAVSGIHPPAMLTRVTVRAAVAIMYMARSALVVCSAI